VFEEIGWRGYMLPHFGPEGSFGAALAVGFLHGVWHLPLMLMTTAYNPAGNRLVTVPFFLAVLTGAGIIYAYLRWTSGSLWPVVIAHGTFNAVLGRLDQAAVTTDVAAAAHLTGETGVFTLAAVWITAVVLTRRYPSIRKAGPDAQSPRTRGTTARSGSSESRRTSMRSDQHGDLQSHYPRPCRVASAQSVSPLR
jgi:hypothetical protein